MEFAKHGYGGVKEGKLLGEGAMSLPPYRRVFTRLTDTNHRKTSEPDPTYNCIGHAAGTKQFWWPIQAIGGNIFWPDTAPLETTIDAFVRAYASKGYERCSDATYEDGYVKVALYAKSGIPQHAALQVSENEWTSKLGKDLDIVHTLESVGGTIYGEPLVFLRRPKVGQDD